MKKTLFFLLACAGLLSCKKNYTCNCTTTTMAYNYSTGQLRPIVAEGDGVSYSQKLSKKNAEAACKHEEVAIQQSLYNAWTDNGYTIRRPDETVTTVCELK